MMDRRKLIFEQRKNQREEKNISDPRAPAESKIIIHEYKNSVFESVPIEG
jgi:hypothetical protein